MGPTTKAKANRITISARLTRAALFFLSRIQESLQNPIEGPVILSLSRVLIVQRLGIDPA